MSEAELWERALADLVEIERREDKKNVTTTAIIRAALEPREKSARSVNPSEFAVDPPDYPIANMPARHSTITDIAAAALFGADDISVTAGIEGSRDLLQSLDGARALVSLTHSCPPIRMGARRKADPQSGRRQSRGGLSIQLGSLPFNDADGLMDGEHSLTSPIRLSPAKRVAR
jgi:hypothetical protein